ncbi:MAG: response regulator [Patescibacteria group bacterium]
MKHILIIDDDETFKSLIQSAFDTAKYSVALAADGVEGLKSMGEKRPDIILLDIKMPNMGGIEFLKEINKKYGEGKTPILITSNISSMDTISEGVVLGIRGYVLKSNESLQGIVEAVERVFNTAV